MLELKKLKKSVLLLWYIRAAIWSLVLLCALVGIAVILSAAGKPHRTWGQCECGSRGDPKLRYFQGGHKQ